MEINTEVTRTREYEAFSSFGLVSQISEGDGGHGTGSSQVSREALPHDNLTPLLPLSEPNLRYPVNISTTRKPDRLDNWNQDSIIQGLLFLRREWDTVNPS